MYFENSRTLPVAPGWTAEFIFRYEVRMCTNGWGLVLHGPGGLVIDRFKDFIIYCSEPEQDSDDSLMGLLSLTKDGRLLTIKTTYEGNWVADLSTGGLAPDVGFLGIRRGL